MEELRTIPPFLTQKVLRKIGMADSTMFGNDIYYELEALNLIINWLGEDFITKEFEKDTGKKWSEMQFQIKEISKRVITLKPMWDMIEDKKWSKIDKDKKMKKLFLQQSKKLPLFGNPVTFMLTWVCKKTSLQRLQVPSDAYKIIEQTGFKTMEVKKEKPQQAPVATT